MDRAETPGKMRGKANGMNTTLPPIRSIIRATE
jgi:hypothetical protein